MGLLPTGIRRRVVWIFLTLAMMPQKGLTFAPVNHPQSTLSQGMSRRYNGGNTALSVAGGQNNNGRAWNNSPSLGPSASSDDLTVMSSTMADNMQDSLQATSSLEIDSGKPQPLTQGQQSLAVTILDHPTLKMGRFLVLLAACIYGTNFSVVKILDDTIPLSVSAFLRFGLAATVVSAMVLSRESDDVQPIVKKERNLAFWGGVEIGLWYCIGYIAQGTS
jgi:hypothetical protein